MAQKYFINPDAIKEGSIPVDKLDVDIKGLVATGKDNIVGLKGLKYFTQNMDTDLTDNLLYFEIETFDECPWSVGTVLSVCNNKKYENSIKIIEVDRIDAGIKFELVDPSVNPFENGFASVTDPKIDDFTVWCHEFPHYGNIDLGVGAFASGENNKSTNWATHAEGKDNHAYGQFAHAEGRETKAGYAAHAEGRLTEATGEMSHTEGYDTTATAHSAHAEGRLSTASGERAHAEGYKTLASGESSHAEGVQTQATAEAAHAEGKKAEATGLASHAEGSSKAANTCAHAEGGGTEASGKYSHAEGNTTKAAGESSHAEGESNTANAKRSHAGGYASITHIAETCEGADAQGAFVHGGHLEAKNAYEAAFGQYNKSIIGDTLFSIGNGVKNKPSNAFEIGNGGTKINTPLSVTGDVTITGDLYTTGTHHIVEVTTEQATELHVEGEAKIDKNLVVGTGLEITNEIAVFGKYNSTGAGTVFSVGTGTDDENRNNIFELNASNERVIVWPEVLYFLAEPEGGGDDMHPYETMHCLRIEDGLYTTTLADDFDLCFGDPETGNPTLGKTYYMHIPTDDVTFDSYNQAWAKGMYLSEYSTSNNGTLYYPNINLWNADFNGIEGTYVVYEGVLLPTVAKEATGYLNGKRILTEEDYDKIMAIINQIATQQSE